MVSPVHGDYRRCQAEIPLIVLCRFPGPALSSQDQFVARLRVLERYFGDAPEASEIDVFFAPSGVMQKFTYPHTPSMKEREYFVVSFVGEDGRRRLLGYPIIQSEYEQWDAERRKYERSR
jgi:hypothetical protein